MRLRAAGRGNPAVDEQRISAAGGHRGYVDIPLHRHGEVVAVACMVSAAQRSHRGPILPLGFMAGRGLGLSSLRALVALVVPFLPPVDVSLLDACRQYGSGVWTTS